MFNFYHLQIPIDKDLTAEGRSTNFLHILISNFSNFAMTCWTYFLATDFNELIAMDLSSDNSKETEHWRQIKQTIKKAILFFWPHLKLTSPYQQHIHPGHTKKT